MHSSMSFLRPIRLHPVSHEGGVEQFAALDREQPVQAGFNRAALAAAPGQ